MRDFQQPGRSVVYGMRGMAATSSVPATQAAIDMLRQGGTAVDAAIAADAVLGVVEPQQTGIGGDLFALLSDAGGPPVAFNGSGRAPAAANAEALRALGWRAIPTDSVHAVTVPGAVDAWLKLHASRGRLPLSQVLAPAIALAEDGFPVAPRVAWDWAREAGRLRGNSAAAVLYLPGGAAPREGQCFRNPALARTLRAIADGGHDAFYRGELAEAMVADLRALGGSHRLEDFAATAGAFVSPISAPLGDARLMACPPNGLGVLALAAMQVLAGLDFARDGADSPWRAHLHVRAHRVVRDAWFAGPCASEHDAGRRVAALLDPAYIARLQAAVRADRPGPVLPALAAAATDPRLGNTVYLCVADAARNVVSLMSSTFHWFGSGLCSARTGVLFHSRGAGFSLEPGDAGELAPAARPPHTLMPAMLVRDERPALAFGVMGGEFQPVGQTWVLSNMLAFGMDPQQAIDHPRVHADDAGTWVESGVGVATVAGLEALGHRVQRAPLPMGGGQAIRIDWDTGVLAGASDPRKDGCALAA